MRRLGVTLVAAGLVFAGEAGAQSFTRADRDVDGYVTFEEARSVMPGLLGPWFDTCDVDDDGRLDGGEYNCLHGIYEVMQSGR